MNIWDKRLPSRVSRFKRDMPKKVERLVEKWFKDNFRLGGEQIAKGRVVKWEGRTRRYKHPTLIENRADGLMSTIKARIQGSVIIVTYGDGRKSRGTTSREYGEYHNRGTENMPARHFMRDSQALTKYLEDYIVMEMKKIL